MIETKVRYPDAILEHCTNEEKDWYVLRNGGSFEDFPTFASLREVRDFCHDVLLHVPISA